MEEIISHIQNSLIRERLPIWLLSITFGDWVRWICLESLGVFKVQLDVKGKEPVED